MAEVWLAAVAAFLAFVAFLPLRVDAALAVDAFERRWRLLLRVALVARPLGWTLRRGSELPAGPLLGEASRPDPAARRRDSAARCDARAVRRPPRGPGANALDQVQRVLRAVRVDRARLAIDLGASDAALTAVGCGAAWAAGGALLAMLPGLAPGHAELEVRPHYGGGGQLACTAELDGSIPVWRALLLSVALRERI